jgi:arylsulfatase A-like enzyme
MDKRQPYDFDTRIHLLARGPGIKPGSTWSQPATQVDMAPTFLGIAGLAKPSTMDGHSLLPLLTAPELQAELPEPTAEHLAELGGVDAYKARWRDAAFIEYYYVADNDKCFENCT